MKDGSSFGPTCSEAVQGSVTVRCPECGWPGVGRMPTGVRAVNRGEKSLLIGQLSYFSIEAVLCSVCEDMKSAVEARVWFVTAHGEYLDQVKAKKQLLEGK